MKLGRFQTFWSSKNDSKRRALGSMQEHGGRGFTEPRNPPPFFMTISMFCKTCGDARDTTLSMRLCRPCYKAHKKVYENTYRHPTLFEFVKRAWRRYWRERGNYFFWGKDKVKR